MPDRFFKPSLQENYWFVPNYQTGEAASLVIDLGCIKEINGLYMKNFHNAHKNNRGTQYFSIYVRYNESQTWLHTPTDPSYLDRVYSYYTKKIQFVSFKETQMVRYIKMTIDTYYGKGGGLSYIAESEWFRGSAYTSKHVLQFCTRP